MSLYKHPVQGRAKLPFTNTLVDVSYQDTKDYSFKRFVDFNRQNQVIFSNAAGHEIMQSCRAIRYVLCKPGEDNISAKLSNAQGIEIFTRANNGESSKDLAKEYNVSVKYVNDIKAIRTRISITLDHMNNVQSVKPANVIQAKANKGKKLSESLAKFIRKDSENKIPVKSLAKKYCVTERTIQRILKGQMYQPQPSE
jgi:Mor family transcriptional regulator